MSERAAVASRGSALATALEEVAQDVVQDVAQDVSEVLGDQRESTSPRLRTHAPPSPSVPAPPVSTVPATSVAGALRAVSVAPAARVSEARLSEPLGVAVEGDGAPSPYDLEPLPQSESALAMGEEEGRQQGGEHDDGAPPRARGDRGRPSNPVSAGPRAQQRSGDDAVEAGTEALTEADDETETFKTGRPSVDDLLMADAGTYEFFTRAPEPPPSDAGSWLRPEPMSQESRRAMWWSLSMLAVSLVAIGGYWAYHHWVMPAPAELTTGALGEPVALLPLPEPAPLPARAAQPAVPAPQPAAASLPPSPPAATITQGSAPDAPDTAPEPEDPQDGYLEQMLQAADLQKNGHMARALSAYEGALQVRPGSAEALAKVAYLHLNARRYPEAGEHAQRAVAADPTSSEGWIVLGAAHQATGERKAAREAYRQCADRGVGEYVTECRRLAR